MNVPMIDLAPQLAAAASLSRQYLDQLFARKHFILGEQVAAFENEFARGTGAAYAVGVGSGTGALELCLRSAGLHGDRREVLTPALTSPFTAQAILAAGGLPRFADVNPETLLLDPASVTGRIGAGTGALLPVHLYGQPCDLVRLTDLAGRLEIPVIQDACQAHGARLNGRPLTFYSPWVAYSFYPTKNLGCLGDGGAVATDEEGVCRQLCLLRDGGRSGDQVSLVEAVNSRLDEIQACYLRAFLPHLEDWNSRRARLASLYDEGLAPCDAVRAVRRGEESVNHLYVIRAGERDRLRQYLAERGIHTGVHYPVPLHLQPAFASNDRGPGSLPHAEKACQEILSLPLWPYMPESSVERVVENIRGFYAR